MWATISKFILNIVISIISDKVIVEATKKMLVKAVDSKVKNVGITNEDAKDLLHTITESSLNCLGDTIIDKLN